MIIESTKLGQGPIGGLAAIGVGQGKKLVPASLMDDLLHLIEVPLEGFSTSRGNSILRARDSSFETLGADYVVRVLQLARVDAEIAVGCLQQALELRKC